MQAMSSINDFYFLSIITTTFETILKPITLTSINANNI